MQKKICGDLAFEVTQNCNLICLHCLRGCRRDISITKEIVDATLDSYDYIQTLLFTGGEPTLNVDIIRYIIDQIKNRQIRVGSFYIVTNATFYSPELVLALLDLYAYCDDYDDTCGLAVSIDQYHSCLNKEALAKYRALKFYREDKEWEDESNRKIIDMGNASFYVPFAEPHKIIQFNANVVDEYDDIINTGDNLIYINAEGYILFDCDLSYDIQDEIKDINILTTNLSYWIQNQLSENIKIAV